MSAIRRWVVVAVWDERLTNIPLLTDLMEFGGICLETREFFSVFYVCLARFENVAVFVLQ